MHAYKNDTQVYYFRLDWNESSKIHNLLSEILSLYIFRFYTTGLNNVKSPVGSKKTGQVELISFIFVVNFITKVI